MADWQAWNFLTTNRSEEISDCHRMLLLFMACEKICKAHKISDASSNHELSELTKSHKYVELLPELIKKRSGVQRIYYNRSFHEFVSSISNHIYTSHPSHGNEQGRADNCEYPWLSHDVVRSPLDQEFAALKMLSDPRQFENSKKFKTTINGAIKSLLDEK
ncbi:hypothetical protein SH248x_002526 [Planctomycetaceae bacterium SH248]